MRWFVSGPVVPVWIPGTQPKPQRKMHSQQWLLQPNSTSSPASATPPPPPLLGLLGYRSIGIGNLTIDNFPPLKAWYNCSPNSLQLNCPPSLTLTWEPLLRPFIFLHLPLLSFSFYLFPPPLAHFSCMAWKSDVYLTLFSHSPEGIGCWQFSPVV